MNENYIYPYKTDPIYAKKVCYCCMEFGVDQALKIYAGGLGFLAGSYMKSAYELKQPIIGVGILWKYGYYDQIRKTDQTMDVLFEEKNYGLLKLTNIKFTIKISNHDVWVTAYYLSPEIFNTAPIYLLSTDIPENDYLAKTISHKLYDANPETRIAAAILLGEGSAKLMETLKWNPDIFHLNESHALPIAFYLYNKYQSIEKVKDCLVFTNHTPEEMGNPKLYLWLLEKMGYLENNSIIEIKKITQTEGDILDITLAALKLSKKANAVSKLHLDTLQRMWNKNNEINKLISITNGQNYTYWHNEEMYIAINNNDDIELNRLKEKGKKVLFEIVADQCGEIYNQNILTIVFAKRFTGYKRPDILFHDMDRFVRLVTNKNLPVQIIWAGKPYPMDYNAIGVFDKIVNICKTYSNCSILSGYELKLSKIMKQGADIWLNVPRKSHEASGTSGITAAMNGAINVAIPDGWFPEFAKNEINSFIINSADSNLPEHLIDDMDSASLYDLLENTIIPMYYNDKKKWNEIVKQGMKDIYPLYDSNRMANEYYELLYK